MLSIEDDSTVEVALKFEIFIPLTTIKERIFVSNYNNNLIPLLTINKSAYLSNSVELTTSLQRQLSLVHHSTSISYQIIAFQGFLSRLISVSEIGG